MHHGTVTVTAKYDTVIVSCWTLVSFLHYSTH